MRALAAILILLGTTVVVFYPWGWIAVLAGTCPAAALSTWGEPAGWFRRLTGLMWGVAVVAALAFWFLANNTFLE